MLKRVSIQNFKSLKNIALDLQKVNLLIGPNNSGKTNFLKALEAFSSFGNQFAVPYDLEQISFKHKPVAVSYSFEFLPDPDGLMAEKTGIAEMVFHYESRYEIESNDGISGIRETLDRWFTNKNNEKSDIEPIGGHIREFSEFIRTKIFRPDPSKLLHKASFSADEVTLNGDCSNLIAYYFYVDTNFKQYSRQIQSDLSKCIPEIAYFSTPPVKAEGKSFLGLRFFDINDIGYWADELSEGTLYFLALLCIIHQPNPPKLLLLEEPEKGIHPRRIEEVINFILGLADEKNIQIILTTHSPIVVDLFKDMPESVFIFDKDEEGATHVKNLQKDIIEPEMQESERLGIDPPQYLNGLGQAWKVGFIGGIPK